MLCDRFGRTAFFFCIKEWKRCLESVEFLMTGFSRVNGVVEIRAESAAFDVQGSHLGIADLEPFLVGRRVHRRVDPEVFALRAADQTQHAMQTRHAMQSPKRVARPVTADRTEHAVFDRVPFRRAARIVTHRDRHFRLVRKLLQFPLP
jgi:hypothetical protein